MLLKFISILTILIAVLYSELLQVFWQTQTVSQTSSCFLQGHNTYSRNMSHTEVAPMFWDYFCKPFFLFFFIWSSICSVRTFIDGRLFLFHYVALVFICTGRQFSSSFIALCYTWMSLSFGICIYKTWFKFNQNSVYFLFIICLMIIRILRKQRIVFFLSLPLIEYIHKWVILQFTVRRPLGLFMA